jgi:MoaA/NifB/PqqE/SkfB family radical SAM enzyme
MTDLRFAWLEITGKCQLSCTHCYADSGPRGTEGAMRTRDWLRVIDHVADLGGQSVQFIGGEPTLHPDLPEFVDRALAAGLAVEIFSNLVQIDARLWDTFSRPGVRLATSYYSDTGSQHDGITRCAPVLSMSARPTTSDGSAPVPPRPSCPGSASPMSASIVYAAWAGAQTLHPP